MEPGKALVNINQAALFYWLTSTRLHYSRWLMSTTSILGRLVDIDGLHFSTGRRQPTALFFKLVDGQRFRERSTLSTLATSTWNHNWRGPGIVCKLLQIKIDGFSANPNINLVMWYWCRGVMDRAAAASYPHGAKGPCSNHGKDFLLRIEKTEGPLDWKKENSKHASGYSILI